MPPTHTPPQLEDRRGAGQDRYGNWYWIDNSGSELLVNSVGTGDTTHFWSLEDGLEYGTQADSNYFQPSREAGPPQGIAYPPQSPSERQGDFQPRPEDIQPLPEQLALSGLAVTDHHYLVVGVLQPAGVLIFDLFAGGPPYLATWPTAVPFVPFDMAPLPGSGVWILDRDNARYWALDRNFNVIRQDQQEVVLNPEEAAIFQPADSSSERRSAVLTFPGGISLHAASPLANNHAIAIEALPDGTVLILESDPDEPFSLIYRYRFSRQLGTPVSTETMRALIAPGKMASFRLRGYDFAFVPEHDESGDTIPDRLYVVPVEGNQVYAFNIWQQDDQLGLQPLPNYFPMRSFGGKGLVAAGNQAYYDFSDLWIPLVEQRRPRYTAKATFYTPLYKSSHTFDGRNPDFVSGANDGRVATPRRHALDGHNPDCMWHRLMLDACIPPETSVQIWSRAANEEGDLVFTPWQQEPNLYLRSDGSELPFQEKVGGEGNGTWELLFQAATGRYLQLKIQLIGNGRSTPRLRAMRIYYPRFSYLEHYLPAVYREDSQSASFLDRFLANLEGLYTTLEDKIAAVQMLFDPRSAPSETLAWLASWFGIVLDLTWDTNKQRLFIRHARDFFQYRGTICGLQMVLQLTFDNTPDETIFIDCLANRPHTSGIRIVEKFRTRQAVGALPSASPGPRWSPARGGAVLFQQFVDFLEQQGLDVTYVKTFSLRGTPKVPSSPEATPDPTDPFTDPKVQAAWKEFVQDTLGFIPSVNDSDLRPWHDFLERRYEKIEALNRAYQSNFATFDDVPLPDTLPPDGPALQDWYQFQTIVLAMRNSAHQFTVLLPAPTSGSAADYQQQLELATRIIEMEKPAHTVFEVKFYLAVFRVGVARLGIDTLVDLGSRTPQLMAPMILGQGYLLEGYLASVENMVDRQTLKREP